MKYSADNCILLDRAILDFLPSMTAAHLKVYIYLSSRYEGAPLAATIAKISQATGFKARAVKTAIGFLEENHLVVKRPGSGNQPNAYSLSFQLNDVDMEHSEIKPPLESVAQTPTPAVSSNTPSAKLTEAKVRSGGLPSMTANRPTAQPTMGELVAKCYKPVDEKAIAELRQLIPDEAELRRRLEWMIREPAGVDPDLPPA